MQMVNHLILCISLGDMLGPLTELAVLSGVGSSPADKSSGVTASAPVSIDVSFHRGF